MFIVIMVVGSFPNLVIVPNKSGIEARVFGTKNAAEKFAIHNCPWSWMVVEWKQS